MKARILIVEDESIVQLDLQRRLQRMGHSVVGMASQGEEAIAKTIELKPDLVIIDVRLDGAMDGLEAARHIRAKQGTPVVYVTPHMLRSLKRQHSRMFSDHVYRSHSERRNWRRRSLELWQARQAVTAAKRMKAIARSEPHRMANQSLRGSVKKNVEPRFGVDSAQIRPPCASTIFRQIASPIPVPAYSR
jgi:CheY-like chemotaxis protein